MCKWVKPCENMCRYVSCCSVANSDLVVKSADWRRICRTKLYFDAPTPLQLNKPSNSPILVFPKNLPVFVDETGGGGFWICDAVGARDWRIEYVLCILLLGPGCKKKKWRVSYFSSQRRRRCEREQGEDGGGFCLWVSQVTTRLDDVLTKLPPRTSLRGNANAHHRHVLSCIEYPDHRCREGQNNVSCSRRYLICKLRIATAVIRYRSTNILIRPAATPLSNPRH